MSRCHQRLPALQLNYSCVRVCICCMCHHFGKPQTQVLNIILGAFCGIRRDERQTIVSAPSAVLRALRKKSVQIMSSQLQLGEASLKLKAAES